MEPGAESLEQRGVAGVAQRPATRVRLGRQLQANDFTNLSDEHNGHTLRQPALYAGQWAP